MKKYLWFLFTVILYSENNYAQSPENKNKIIVNYWNANRAYTYQITYTDSNNQLITKEDLLIKPTGELWEADKKQTLADFSVNFKSADSTKLAPYPINEKMKLWLRKWQEGVIQNESKIWMHPVRQNQYQLTEIAPFPEVKLPI